MLTVGGRIGTFLARGRVCDPLALAAAHQRHVAGACLRLCTSSSAPLAFARRPTLRRRRLRARQRIGPPSIVTTLLKQLAGTIEEVIEAPRHVDERACFVK